MPLYEYTCGKCGGKFENLAKTSNEPDPACPKCKSKDVKKTVSGFSSSCGGCGSSSPSTAPKATRHFG